MSLTALFFHQVVKMFLILMVGYIAVKSRLLPAESGKGMAQVITFVITPINVFFAFQVACTPERVGGFFLSFGAAVLAHAVMILMNRFAGVPLLRLDPVEQTSTIYTNCGNLLMPLIVSTMGQEWLFYTCAFAGVMTCCMWIHGKCVLCEERKIDWKKAFLNPSIVSIIIGVILFFTPIRITGIFQEAFTGITACLGAMSMMAIGINFAGLRDLDLHRLGRVLLVTFIRLIFFPLLVLGLFLVLRLHTLLPDAGNILMVSILATGAPAAALIPQMAQIYDKDAAYASFINVVTMLCSIFTMPALVWIFEHFVGVG